MLPGRRAARWPCLCGGFGTAVRMGQEGSAAAGAEQAGPGAGPLRVSQSHMNGAAPLSQLAPGIIDLGSSPDSSPGSSPAKVLTCSVRVAGLLLAQHHVEVLLFAILPSTPLPIVMPGKQERPSSSSEQKP